MLVDGAACHCVYTDAITEHLARDLFPLLVRSLEAGRGIARTVVAVP